MYDVMFAGNASFKRVNKCLMMVNECENPRQADDEPEDGSVTVTSLDLQTIKPRVGRLVVRGSHSNHSNHSNHSSHGNYNDVRRGRSVTSSSVSSEDGAMIEMQSVSEIASPRDNLSPRDSFAPEARNNLAPRESFAPRDNPAPHDSFSPRDNPAPRDSFAPGDNFAPRSSPPSPMPTPDFSIPLPIPMNSDPIPKGMGLLPCMIPLDDKGPDSPPMAPPPRTHRRQTAVVSEV